MTISRRGLFGLFAGAAATPIAAMLPKSAQAVNHVRIAKPDWIRKTTLQVRFCDQFTQEATQQLAMQLYKQSGGQII